MKNFLIILFSIISLFGITDKEVKEGIDHLNYEIKQHKDGLIEKNLYGNKSILKNAKFYKSKKEIDMYYDIIDNKIKDIELFEGYLNHIKLKELCDVPFNKELVNNNYTIKYNYNIFLKKINKKLNTSVIVDKKSCEKIKEAEYFYNGEFKKYFYDDYEKQIKNNNRFLIFSKKHYINEKIDYIDHFIFDKLKNRIIFILDVYRKSFILNNNLKKLITYNEMSPEFLRILSKRICREHLYDCFHLSYISFRQVMYEYFYYFGKSIYVIFRFHLKNKDYYYGYVFNRKRKRKILTENEAKKIYIEYSKVY